MMDARAYSGYFYVILAISSAVFLSSSELTAKSPDCPSGFVNIGDSLTDTGNALNAFPYYSDPENPPYGETFFGAPAKRFSNGRVVPDFFALAFGVPLLDPYFAPTTFNYRYGINFAVGGATASLMESAIVPFSMTFQVNQFIRFRNNTKVIASQNACDEFDTLLPRNSDYAGWLFTIEIGGNDILSALGDGTTPQDIINTVIPDAVNNITTGIKKLYAQSARKFLVFNIPAQGCSTVILTLLRNLFLPTDDMGCIISINDLAQSFNALLSDSVQELRANLSGVTISLFDYYNANLEILQNPATYGFDPKKTFVACCGAPGQGTLNYNSDITCGHPEKGSNNCANPDEYVIWDGVHFTENFYRTITKFALSNTFTDEGVDYTTLCDLDFRNFNSSVTYREAYPDNNQCVSIYA